MEETFGGDNPDNPIAWLVKDCPNFYFLPSMYYDQMFLDRGDVGKKMSLAYWESVGFVSLPLYRCEDERATHWIVNNNYALFDTESADAARALNKEVVPVRLQKDCG